MLFGVWRLFRVLTPEEGDRPWLPFLGTFETANLILALSTFAGISKEM
jgi:hypothetical protein